MLALLSWSRLRLVEVTMSFDDLLGIAIVLLMVAGLFVRDAFDWLRNRYRG